MKIRWVMRTPGIYVTDTGRFAISRSEPDSVGEFDWLIYDKTVDDDYPIDMRPTFKAAKKFVDDILTAEESRQSNA